MLLLSNKSRFKHCAAILLCVIFAVSCDYIDFRPVGIIIEPGEIDSVLADADSPVVLRFDTEMIKKEAEGLLQINSDSGAVYGDKFWEENDLYFVPAAGWTAGVRYTLTLTGTMRSADGRELRIDHYVSFYAINKNDPPVLESFSPSNGESKSVNGVVYEFHFSRSMDRLSVESALLLDGTGNKTYEWLADDKILNVIPDKPLSPWVLYNWNLRESAKSADGVPLHKPYNGFFKTDLDKELPKIINIYPVLTADGLWYPTGAGIETGLGIGNGIAVEFNKKIGESVLRSIRFEPSLAGRIEFLSDTSIVYIFSRTIEPGKYQMIISGDIKDSEGLKIGSDYFVNFIPDIPVLEIISLSSGGDVNYVSSLKNNAKQDGIILPVYIDPVTGQLNISIHFSLMFGKEEMKNTPQKITLNPFFPRTLSPVAIQYVNWISDDRLFIRWEGLVCENNEAPNYYKLIIPGGRGGISPARDIFMEEDLIIYLEAIPDSEEETVK